MLRDDMELYTKLTGEDGTHVPIIKLCAYLDGYEKGLSVLEDIKAEINDLYFPQTEFPYMQGRSDCLEEVFEIIDKYISGK